MKKGQVWSINFIFNNIKAIMEWSLTMGSDQASNSVRHAKQWWSTQEHTSKSRSNVSCQMASIFFSDNISLFTNFAQAEDVIATSHSKWPMKKHYIMYVNYMPILIFGSSFDVNK